MSLKKLGRYDLIRVLGKGAMGLVYEGRDPNLDRRVAIKTIKVENLSEEAAAEYEVRFRTEARSAARLQHPNIVSVYDSDRDGDIAFLVMEFIQGDDLKHHLDQGELYTLQESLAIMADLLSALDYAHKQSIVHRDIKPANLLIEAGGRVKLTDFGVARIQDSGEATRTQGSMVGTLKYMSPEQVQGRPIDARADIFAAGIVLYQLLTGKRPFDGDTDFATIQQIVGHTPAGPTSFNARLPAALDAVVAKALAKSRDLRYASAQEFGAALQAACREAADPLALPPASPPGPGSSSTWTSTLMAGEALVTNTGIANGLGTNTGTLGSAVTQEVELVYWKDIKDSMDVEDIQGFLAKFPAGIYADLARRRLRKLGVATVDATDTGLRSGTGTLVVPRGALPGSAAGVGTGTQGTAADTDSAWQALEAAAVSAAPSAAGHDLEATRLGAPMVPAFVGDEETVVLARPKPAQMDSGDKTLVMQRVHAAEEPATPAVPKEVPEQATAKVQTGTDAKKPEKQTAANASPPSAPSRRTGLMAAAVVVLMLAGAGAMWLSGRGAPQAPPAAAVDPAALPASASVAAASAAASQSTASTPAATPTASTASPAASAPVAAAKAAAVAAAKKAAADKERLAKQAPAKPAAAPAAVPATERAAAPAAASGPRQICEGRMLLGFQVCMAEQCAKPAFAQFPVCVERRAMDQRRRDAELTR